MADMDRVRVVWQGTGVVGGGVSTFYTLGLGGDLAIALNTFFSSIKDMWPPSVDVFVENTGETLDSVTGAVGGSWSRAAMATNVGTGGANYAAGVGGCITWTTAGFYRRRAVKGRTYLVPLTAATYDSHGTISDGTPAAVGAKITTLLADVGGEMCVWSRPRTTSSADGLATIVTGGFIKDQVSWLRSRRV